MDQHVVVLVLAALMAGLFVIERRAALRRQTRPLLGRLLVNAAVSVLALVHGIRRASTSTDPSRLAE